MQEWDLAQLSDEELMAQLQKGRKEALGELIRRYERELYIYLRRFTSDPILAEDIFQNTFLQVLQRAKQYQLGRAVRPWLYAIATNLAIDALRRSARRQAASLERTVESERYETQGSLLQSLRGPSREPFEALEEKERAELVQQALQSLPESLRAVVLLAYFRGLKYQDIADILGIPIGTVKSRLHVALKRIHDWLQARLAPEASESAEPPAKPLRAE
ncbi:MAG: sigma-70 family RNA polymerase sigma factor [Gemmatales bacterium]|nr:sigma-70 family RNA polymerase sigma factor [Gemmatales bacterium]MDW7994769.1 sigma-70 family RNA polymerase sigma factor [Gemmatales bacterium]